jgi:hypothetical protein
VSLKLETSRSMTCFIQEKLRYEMIAPRRKLTTNFQEERRLAVMTTPRVRTRLTRVNRLPRF